MEENESIVLAKNSFVPAREHYAQTYQAMMKISDVLMLGFIVLMTLVLVLSAVIAKQPFFSRDNLVPLIALGIALIAVAVQHFVLPRLYAKNAEKRIREACGGVGALITIVYEDGVVMYNEANDSTVGFRFDAFRRFSETKDLLLLRTHARQTLILSKTGFEQGDEASFKALMREKCPGAKASLKK